MKWQRWIGGMVVAAALAAGCVPTRYAWSPDGKWMTVLSDKGLNIAGASGKLLPAFAAGVNVAAWFPDSRRLLAARQIDAATWDELAQYLTPQEIKAVAEAAAQVRQAALTYDWSNPKTGNWLSLAAKVKAQATGDTRVYDDLGSGIGLYVRDHADAALRRAVPDAQWNKLQSVTQTINAVQIYELDGTELKAGAVLMTTPRPVDDLRVSPTGAAATVNLTQANNDEGLALWAVATSGDRPPLKISDLAAWYPDWSPDGREVVFMRAEGKGHEFGELSRVRVIGDDGRLLEKCGPTEDLAGMMFDGLSRVRCLKDGRIIFSSMQVTLPATPADVPSHGELFCIDPGRQATVTRLIPRQALQEIGDSVQYFTVSPDAKWAAIPDGSGKVTVMELATGKVTQVQTQPFASSSNNGNTLPTVATWRNDDELTFLEAGEAGRPVVRLWSMSKKSGQDLSAGWPADLLPKEKPPAATQSTRP